MEELLELLSIEMPRDVDKHQRNLGERVAAIEAHIAPKSTSPLLIAFLSFIGIVVAGYWGWVGVQIVDHGKKLSAMSQLLITQGLMSAAANPSNEANQVAALKVLSGAKDNSVAIPLQDFKSAAFPFLDNASTDPGAAKVTNAFLNYRSILNARLAPSRITKERQYNEHWRLGFALSFPPGKAPGKVYWSGHTNNPAEIPVMYIMRDGPRSPPLTSGPSFLWVFGGYAALDDMHLKRVIFSGVNIVYNGTQAHLDQVYFLNCNFEIRFNPEGQRFSREMIASLPVTFTATQSALSDRPHSSQASNSANPHTRSVIPASIAGVRRKLE